MRIDFHRGMIVILVVGSAFHPFAAALALLILQAVPLAEKYFTRNITDVDRSAIAALKDDVKGLKEKQSLTDLSKVFGARSASNLPPNR